MKRWTSVLFSLALLLLFTTVGTAANTHGDVHNHRYDGYTIRQGIDVSEHNGKVDWRTVAASGQADFAFIRVGYRGYSSGGLYPDSRYKENLEGALAAGFDVGVYIYSQATTPAEAEEEAYYALELLGKYANRLTLPIVIDFEYAESGGYVGRLYDAHLSAAAATAVCNAFCDVIENAGFEACVYANPIMLGGKLLPEELRGTLWLANYIDETSYTGDYTFWQYTSSGGVYGCSGAVDRNYWYAEAPDRRAVRADAVWLGEESLELWAGESLTLEAEIEPRNSIDTVRYYSADPTIAYVDKLTGELTAFRAGTTEIIATTSQGVSASCRVTVSGTRDEAPSITIQAAPDTVYSGVGTVTDLVVTTDSYTGATAKVGIDYLNLRPWPNTDYAPVEVLTKGTSVTILDSTVIDDLQWLALETADGIRGYAAADYLVDIQSESPLVEGLDYRVSYQNNDHAGTATVTVEGLGEYRGRDSAEFMIYHFNDVATSDWYFEPVRKAVQNGLMNGMSGDSFAPNAETNRAMLAVILFRMEGEPAVADAKYNDVHSGDWFADAIDWVTDAKIDQGYASGNFGPTDTLTRAQMVTMLYRYASYLGYATPVDRSYGQQFADWANVPGSAQDAICWAVETGIINGIDGQLSPKTGATRAQICTVLERFQQLLDNSAVMAQENTPSLAGD